MMSAALPENIEQKTIQRILSGDVSVFSEIISNHQQKIRSYIFKRCSNHADAEDITQEIFIAAYNNLPQYDNSKPFSAWLFGIARNKSNEHFRKAKRVPIPSDDTPEISHLDTPDAQISTSERSNNFWNEAKSILNEEQFTSIWLKYHQEFSISEISSAMKVTESNAKIHLFRARKKLSTSTIINQLVS